MPPKKILGKRSAVSSALAQESLASVSARRGVAVTVVTEDEAAGSPKKISLKKRPLHARGRQKSKARVAAEQEAQKPFGSARGSKPSKKGVAVRTAAKGAKPVQEKPASAKTDKTKSMKANAPKPKTAQPKTAKPTPVIQKPALDQQRAGFVAIIGAPNAGKSTLLNTMIGQKISIVSPKAQTTRSRVLGVLTEGDVQACLIDTPGIFTAKGRLDHAMVDAAWQSLEDADMVIWLVDAATRQDERNDAIIAELKRREQRVTLVLNKVDKMNSTDKLLPLTQRLFELGVADKVFMISALKGSGVDDLQAHMLAAMPQHPWMFDEEQLSDLPARILAAEMTREQIFRQLQQELPYGAMVQPETWETRADGSAVITQTIVVARTGHRAIMLGKGGAQIKAIGEAARRDIAEFLGTKVHLFLNVKVDEKWQDRAEFYAMFGLNKG